MAKSPYPHLELLDLYERLVATIPNLERKGKATPYTSLNGNMFTFLDKEGNLSLRLNEEDRKGLIDHYDAQPSIQHGSIMKEYLIAPNDLISNEAALIILMKKSYDYATTLKPKPTKKKK